jgi:peroxiredoxin Q/BCP
VLFIRETTTTKKAITQYYQKLNLKQSDNLRLYHKFCSFPIFQTIHPSIHPSISTMKFVSAIVSAACLMASTDAFVSKPAASASSALNLAIGEAAPDFSLADQNGKTVKRSSFKKPLVVYFYPADSTPGCTKQANGFNERINEIRKTYGADVVGISGQGVESKQEFAQKQGLTFSILADEGDAVRSDFGVPKAAFGLFPGRVTYVLDKKGECVLSYSNLGDAESHIDKAVEALEGLKSAAPSNPFSSIFG